MEAGLHPHTIHRPQWPRWITAFGAGTMDSLQEVVLGERNVMFKGTSVYPVGF